MNTEITPSTAPVITSFATLVQPTSDLAKRLHAEAAALTTKEGRQSGLKGINSGRRDIFMLSPYLLRIKEGWNSREANDPENLAHIDELAQSIAEIGVKEPLTVNWENEAPFITDGHCRLMATFRAIEVYGAEVVAVPVKTEDRYASEADRLLSQIVRNGSKPLKPLEQGRVFKRLLGLGWDVKRVASSVGKTVKFVENCLMLDGAPTEVRDLVATGKVAASEAVAQVRKHGGEQAAVALTTAVAKAATHGKTRVTRKDMEQTPKQRLRALVEAGKVRQRGDEVSVTFTADDWAALRTLAGL